MGAALIGALRRRHPEAEFAGVGGERMAGAGCRLLANPVQRSAMLAGALLTESRYWWKLLREIRREMEAVKPAVVVPIDSSFINLRIAATAKKAGFPVCYYVAPQVWASRPWRVRKIRKCVDTLCCMFPFEEKYFTDRGVHAVYVGHPMFDGPLSEEAPRPPFPPGEPRVALFPGSRKAEVRKHMGPMLAVAGEIKKQFPGAVFVIAAPSEERAAQMKELLRDEFHRPEIRMGEPEGIIRWADLVLTKSGTTTLQVARQGKPMVVVFAVPAWQWAAAKPLILTKHIAMVNILAGREVVPEVIPWDGSAGRVSGECMDLLINEPRRVAMVEELRRVVEGLWPREGIPAGERVATEVLRLAGAGGGENS